MHRGNDLILLDSGDQFHAALLPLPRVRYANIGPRERRERLPLDFEYLGLTVTELDFERLPDLVPTFAARLREYYSGAKPLATVILARDEAEVGDLLHLDASVDFACRRDGRRSNRCTIYNRRSRDGSSC